LGTFTGRSANWIVTRVRLSSPNRVADLLRKKAS